MEESPDYVSLAAKLTETIRGGKPPLEPLEGAARGEEGILRYLSANQNGALSGDISRAQDLSTGRTAINLKDMENKGWIQRIPDEADGRRVRVFLTREGLAVARRSRSRVQEYLAGLLEALGPGDAREFVRLMGKVCEIERTHEE